MVGQAIRPKNVYCMKNYALALIVAALVHFYGGCTGQKSRSEIVRLVVTALVRELFVLHLH